MRIGLISDTHIPLDANMLPPHIRYAFRGVDLILHAGDIYVPAVLDGLETIAPVIGVRGNGDTDFPQDPRLQETQVLEMGGLRLGATHGFLYPEFPPYSFEEMVRNEFGGPLDIIVFGDTHVALNEEYKGVLLINPGSPTVPNGLFKLGTVGLLEIEEGKVEASILDLGDFSGLLSEAELSSKIWRVSSG